MHLQIQACSRFQVVATKQILSLGVVISQFLFERHLRRPGNGDRFQMIRIQLHLKTPTGFCQKDVETPTLTPVPSKAGVVAWSCTMAGTGQDAEGVGIPAGWRLAAGRQRQPGWFVHVHYDVDTDTGSLLCRRTYRQRPV